MTTYDEQKIRDMILDLDNMYSADATGYTNELDRLVGDMSPYSEGDELTDDDANLIDTVENFLNNN